MSNTNRNVHTVQHNNESSDSSSEEVHTEVNTVRIMSVDGSSDGYWAEPQLEGHSVKIQIDTSSKASLLSHKLYKKYMRHLPVRPSDTVFKAYTGHWGHMEGMTDVTVIYNGQTKKLPVYVTCYNGTCMATWNSSWLAVSKLSHSLTPLQEILEKNSDVFRDELGSMKDISVKLHVKADSKPVFMKGRPVPYAVRTKVEADLDALVKNSILEPVTISEWATPIGHRPVLLAEQYPLPLIADLFSGLSGGKNSARYFSVRLTWSYQLLWWWRLVWLLRCVGAHFCVCF